MIIESHSPVKDDRLSNLCAANVQSMSERYPRATKDSVPRPGSKLK